MIIHLKIQDDPWQEIMCGWFYEPCKVSLPATHAENDENNWKTVIDPCAMVVGRHWDGIDGRMFDNVSVGINKQDDTGKFRSNQSWHLTDVRFEVLPATRKGRLLRIHSGSMEHEYGVPTFIGPLGGSIAKLEKQGYTRIT